MNKSVIKSNAFRYAHQVKSFFNSWSDALRAGWILSKLFLGRVVNLTFAKSSGEIREAVAVGGSLKTIEKGYVKFVERIDEATTQWRSFRLERLVFQSL